MTEMRLAAAGTVTRVWRGTGGADPSNRSQRCGAKPSRMLAFVSHAASGTLAPEFLMPPSGRTPLSTEVKWFVGVLAFLLVTFVGGFLLFMQELAKL